MGHRNHNLSYIAAADIHAGRALQLQSDGTVRELEDINLPIIGWAQENVHAGFPVSVRLMVEGTLMVEFDPLDDWSISAGKMLELSRDTLGTVRTRRNEISSTSTTVTVGSGEVTFNNVEDTFVVDELVGLTCWFRDGTNAGKSGIVTANGVNSITVQTTLTTWEDVTLVTTGANMMGYSLERREPADTTKKYIHALIIRQLSMSERQ